MSYVEESLLPQESIVAATKLHPIIFWKPVALVLLSILSAFDAKSGAPLGLLLLAALATIGPFIRYKTSEFAVTNKRVIVKDGFLRRRSLELNLSKIESVAVNQGLVGRLFGYGTLRVRGTGSTNERFRGIAHALEFRHELQLIATA
jgi:uncharacterized membrane protein YdbT with pleckstrin-like domain